ncbi:MAG: DUF424 family protein [Candidatus Aenigmatarchaeota archaeon]
MQLKNKFWCKVVVTKTDFLVAICDKKLLGKKIKIDKDFSIRINERFYKERLIGEEEAKELMSKATILNLFGEEIVKLAADIGIISMENVIYFDGVPHAQYIKI